MGKLKNFNNFQFFLIFFSLLFAFEKFFAGDGAFLFGFYNCVLVYEVFKLFSVEIVYALEADENDIT